MKAISGGARFRQMLLSNKHVCPVNAVLAGGVNLINTEELCKVGSWTGYQRPNGIHAYDFEYLPSPAPITTPRL